MAEFKVTTAADVVNSSDGVTSLREAIESSNTTIGKDTITFDESLLGSTIVLDSGELSIADDTTIIGLGVDQLTIDGDAKGDGRSFDDSRIFNIDGGATGADLDVAISDLTIANGYTGGNGGGIYNAENLNLTNVEMIENYAFNYGGGIFNGSGTLKIENSVLFANDGTLGGGIYNANGVIEAESASFIRNYAFTSGGGLYNYEGSVVLTNSTLYGNEGAFGGAITNSSDFAAPTGTLSLINSTVSGNYSEQFGGGIYNYDPSGTTTLTNSLILVH